MRTGLLVILGLVGCYTATSPADDPAADRCGDGIVGDTEGGDDANLTAGDGCSAGGTIEAGWRCVAEPSVCTDIDECATGNGGCDANATCTHSEGSRACVCRPGYTGDGVTCTTVAHGSMTFGMAGSFM